MNVTLKNKKIGALIETIAAGGDPKMSKIESGLHFYNLLDQFYQDAYTEGVKEGYKDGVKLNKEIIKN